MVWATVGGMLAGSIVAVLVMSGWESEPDPITGDEAEAMFVAAWERSERGTYYVESTFLRVMADGRELESPVEVVRRPPDYLRFQFGGVDGRLGGRPVVCTSDPDGVVACDLARTPPVPHDDLVDEVMSRWEGYFEGDVPLYRVSTEGDGCFDLRLARFELEPPYGTYARFCFDEATGAVTETEIRREEGTDFVEAVQVRAQVSDADFQLPS
jgi:hypothetical protein